MATTQKTRGKLSPADEKARQAAREATRAVNANLSIDLEESFSADELEVERQVARSLWPARFQELADLADQGDAEYGKFYKVGQFTAKSGARGVIAKFKAVADSMGITLLARKVDGGGSHLMASVAEVNEDGDGEDTEEDGDEA